MSKFYRKVKRTLAKENYKIDNKKILSRYRNFFNDYWQRLNKKYKKIL